MCKHLRCSFRIMFSHSFAESGTTPSPPLPLSLPAPCPSPEYRCSDATALLLQTKGEVHHDRRLHQLLLFEASREWASRISRKGVLVSAAHAHAHTPTPSMKVEERDSADCRNSMDSHARVASSPTDSVSSLHDALHHDFRLVTLDSCRILGEDYFVA